MIDYTWVSMPAILRDWTDELTYKNKEHQQLVDIADSLYNVGINPKEFKADYKDLYNKYGKEYFDKVLDDMRALDSQLTDFDKAQELATDYYDRVGDANYSEDWYGSYQGPSEGYGVYSYRNEQEDSYTYAKDYDEALRYAKWDLTHKNYIDLVRIIDNATGEIVGEFDSLDSIGESYKRESIYTVFPKDDNFLPQDFDTMQKAKSYAKELKDEFDVDSTIEGTDGVLEKRLSDYDEYYDESYKAERYDPYFDADIDTSNFTPQTPVKLKDLKNGEYFTLKDIPQPKDSQVWVKGEYDKYDREWICYKFSDVNQGKGFKGDKLVYTDFIF